MSRSGTGSRAETGEYRLGFDGRMYVLAFDHRGNFRRRLFGIEGEPDEEQTARIAASKRVVFDGLVAAAATGDVSGDQIGVLVDEQFGGEVPALARENGMLLSMPAEKSDQAVFDFEYGEEFGEHISAHGVSFTKVLVRQNPDGDAEGNRVQLQRLKRLADWLHENDTAFLYELLVPPTDEQLEAAGGDAERFEREQRPELIRRAMADAQAAGVEADIWKLEGIHNRAEAEMLVAQARNAPHREDVVCVLLGAGAPDDRVREWMEVVAPVEGFAGFAIGRSIWMRPLERLLAHEIDREGAVETIATKYLDFVRFYDDAASGPQRRTV
ncbi:MAG: DUF2090 domain-containing protein [Actinomycetota bacterium]|nr:DUF2090 domain-containing protein [Actinomycetota bacterium]